MSDSSDTDQDEIFGTTKEAELHAAIREGDPRKILGLIEAGADIHYKRRHGYDALVDAVHSNVVDDDSGLLELLALLIAKGVDLSGVGQRTRIEEVQYAALDCKTDRGNRIRQQAEAD